MQRIVDGRQRHVLAAPHRFFVQHLGRHVPVAAAEQQARQRHALARRPQPGLAQELSDAP